MPSVDVSADKSDHCAERERRIEGARTAEGVEKGVRMADSATKAVCSKGPIADLTDPASGSTGHGRERMGCTDTEWATRPARSAARLASEALDAARSGALIWAGSHRPERHL